MKWRRCDNWCDNNRAITLQIEDLCYLVEGTLGTCYFVKVACEGTVCIVT